MTDGNDIIRFKEQNIDELQYLFVESNEEKFVDFIELKHWHSLNETEQEEYYNNNVDDYIEYYEKEFEEFVIDQYRDWGAV